MIRTESKILMQEELAEKVKAWQAEGQKVVFSNGCFDILHLGHIDYLEKARLKGDRLVIGLNSDASVQRLKGRDRPIIGQYARCRVLAALSFVDAVTLFEEDTPLQLIQKLQPDVLVKGSDYLPENIVGAEVVLARGGKVETIELVEGYSTTKIIERIKRSCS
ncbi:MAG: D-glycero-beta-D-manno-heptose 1-phosphate adenylyltransferase [Microscillaceae bacterium]|nr:D-glycero-beta-D-manno-heptose 1-phosphate adenylyltransferase [Microscillaceae bacterium]MDW8460517.1 D-glycero-beta-D-manno-heptose 1-phosphate adenylyltransferase [Cytophagales bacterium]